MLQSEIIQDLIARTEENIKAVSGFKEIDDAILQKNPSEKSWNVFQCIEHLNRYSEFYLLEFSKRLKKPKLKMSNQFQSGYWGKKFTTAMLPKENMVTMNAFKSKNPINDQVNTQVLNTFIKDQKEFIKLLDKANEADLNRNSCNITIPLLKMRLGDTLRFYTFHNVRHVVQAQKILKRYNS